MKWLSGLFLVSCMFLMFGCKKYIKPEYPYENGCERFAGEYIMYDPINDEHYTMIIDCTTSSDPDVLNTFVFTNYANQFDFVRSKKNYPEAPGHIGINIIDPIIDKNGNRWVFTNGGGGT